MKLTDSKKIYRHESVQLYSTTDIHYVHTLIHMSVHICNLRISRGSVRTNLFSYTQPQICTSFVFICTYCYYTYVTYGFPEDLSARICSVILNHSYTNYVYTFKVTYASMYIHNICNLRIPGKSIGANLFSYTQPQIYITYIH